MKKLLSLLALLLVLATLIGCTAPVLPDGLPGDSTSDTDNKGDDSSQGNNGDKDGDGKNPGENPNENPDENPDGNPDDTPSSTLKVTYDFSSATGKGTELTEESALSLFLDCSDNPDAKLASIRVAKIYNGAGQGGAHAGSTGLLKTGTSKSDACLALTYAQGLLVTKVELVCHDFYAQTEDKPENGNCISVNGSDAVLAPYNGSGEGETLTFTLDTPASVLTVDIQKRIYIYGITVYLEGTATGGGTDPDDGSGSDTDPDDGTGSGSDTNPDTDEDDFESYGLPVITVDLSAVTVAESGIYSSMKEVGAYIHLFGHLPSNFVLDKSQPKKDYTPQNKISAGGTTFYNNEGHLPASLNGSYIECDIDYTGGNRNAKRIVYSKKGPIFYTSDHYSSFSILRFVFGSAATAQAEGSVSVLTAAHAVVPFTQGGVYGLSPKKPFCLPAFLREMSV